MEAIADYILNLCCGALLCAIVLSIGDSGGTGGKTRRMICGLFLAFLVISPLRDMDLSEFTEELENYTDEANAAADAGAAQSRSAMIAVISERTESYILDKAAALSIELEARVTVDTETLLPVSVELNGNATPEQAQVLTGYIRDTLGIEENHQQWIK